MAHAATADTTPEPSYLEVTKGWKSWAYTLDHKRIGFMYLIGILCALLLGGAFALLVRAELFLPGETIVGQARYNELFTLHGAVMVFLVIVPGIPAALGNFILPIQLGAPDVAFPRLNLASFYLWCIGAGLMILSIVLGGIDTGWTFYTPYSLTSQGAVIPAVLGVFVLGFSSIFTGLNFLVTVHKFRPQGMGWFQMPLNLWALYSTAVIQVLATPVLGITVLLLFVENFLHIGIFNPELGGDPVLFQHFFWFYSHPAVYIMIIPAMGVVSEIITTFSRKPIFGYRFIAYSSISLALLSFLVWGHHLFVSGQSKLATMVFSALTFTVAIPSAIKVFNWVATLYKGDIRLQTPMLYVLSFLLLFTIGGLTGLFLGVLSRRRPPPRHVLRGRPLPLRDDGLDAGRLHGRAPLLVPEDHRPDVPGEARAAVRLWRVRRLQPDVPAAVHHGLARHAAALLGLRSGVHRLPPAVDGRRVHPRHLAVHRRDLPGVGGAQWREGAEQPVGRHDPRVVGADPARALQLLVAARGARDVRVRRPGRGHRQRRMDPQAFDGAQDPQASLVLAGISPGVE